MNLTKKISLAVLLTFSAVTVLSAHPAPRPRYRPAPVRISSPDFLIPGFGDQDFFTCPFLYKNLFVPGF